MAEGQTLCDAIHVRGVDGAGAAEVAAALGLFGLRQVAFAGARPQDFAAGGNLEPLGGGLLGLDAFWTSHKESVFFQKERAI